MRLFGICPRIRGDSGCLVATTAWRVRLVFLGAIFRRVTVDPKHKTLHIRSRYLWWFGSAREYPFADIEAVTYGYEDMSSGSWTSYAHDGYDWFTVGLRLKDDTEFRLFNFIGDGTFTNNGPLPDWAYWDEFLLDITGGQEKESRLFVDLLSKMIGVTVIPPRYY